MCVTRLFRDIPVFMLFLIMLLPGARMVPAAVPPPVISEIMFNPDGDENAREYVELYNPADEPADLSGWLIGDDEALDDIVPVAEGTPIIPAGSYALVLDPDYFDAGDPYDTPPDAVLLTVDDSAIGARGLSNSTPETVYLVTAAGDTAAAVTYDISCPAGHSWEMIRLDGGGDSSNFAPSTDIGGTPGRMNSVTPPPVNPALDAASIFIGAANPVAGGSISGTVSYVNAGSESLSDIDVILYFSPDRQVGVCRFDTTVMAGGRSETCEFTTGPLPGGKLELTAAISTPYLQQPADDDTVRVNVPVTVSPGTVILNEVMAAPFDGPEWVELRNTGEWPVDLSGWRVADNSGAVSDGAGGHRFIEPDGFALLAAGDIGNTAPGTPVLALDRFPALNNDGDSVILIDHTGATTDSMAYDAAIRGQSFERISPGMDSATAWDVSTAAEGATPGSENSIAWNGGGSGGSGAELTIDPNPFLDSAEVMYRLPFPVARVTLAVYDRRGRLVATLRDAGESGAMWSGSWDGCGDGGRLPAGPYILSLEALDKRTGRMVHAREMVVVAAEL